MSTHTFLRARPLGVAAAAAISFGLATPAAAHAAPASSTASVAYGTLTVTGTSHSDVVALAASGDPSTWKSTSVTTARPSSASIGPP
jgi:hypothetical protein